MSSNGKVVRIAVDAMGGDFAPREIIKGAVQAAEQGNIEILLVGLPDVIQAELSLYDNAANLPIHIIPAHDVIEESENPAFAVYRKPDASIVVASKLVKSGDADALVGAGATGAYSISAIRFIGTIEGISRPALGATIDVLAPSTILIDCGANVDCKPHQLLSFGIAGAVYAKKLLNIDNPTVALLNVGTEPGKGNQLVKETYPLFQKSGLNFIGFIESSDILNEKANVVVCDGFVGNVLIKFYESIGHYVSAYVKEKFGSSGTFSPAKKLLKQTFSLTSMPDIVRTGGGLLWGIDGIAMKMHGNVTATQVFRTLLKTRDTINADVINYLKVEIAKMNQN